MWNLKTASLSDCDVKFASNDGEFSGYASVFGVVDDQSEVLMPGAYEDVLKQSKNVPVYVNHGWMRRLLPVGKWAGLKEDEVGLLGSAALEVRMPSAADAYWGMKSGLVDGLSVAILPDPSGMKRRSDGVIEIHRVKALKEISIVDVPANEAARIISVKFKDDIEELETIKDFERFLRDAGGLSKGLALALTSRAKSIFLSDSGGWVEAKAMQELDAALKRLQARIPQ